MLMNKYGKNLGHLKEILERMGEYFVYLDEGIRDDLKPPPWVKGYEPIWWAAVARLGDDMVDKNTGKGNFGQATRIFKIYLKRFTGLDVDDLKSQGKKPTDSVAAEKAEKSFLLKMGDSKAASMMAKMAYLNKVLKDIILVKDDAEFLKLVQDKIYQKYLSQGEGHE
jgi:hypothetical protein